MIARGQVSVLDAFMFLIITGMVVSGLIYFAGESITVRIDAYEQMYRKLYTFALVKELYQINVDGDPLIMKYNSLLGKERTDPGFQKINATLNQYATKVRRFGLIIVPKSKRTPESTIPFYSSDEALLNSLTPDSKWDAPTWTSKISGVCNTVDFIEFVSYSGTDAGEVAYYVFAYPQGACKAAPAQAQATAPTQSS